MGGQAPRILSLDDYFMTEVTKTEIDPETNKKVERKVLFLCLIKLIYSRVSSILTCIFEK